MNFLHRSLLLLALLLGTASARSFADPVVINGGFETGTFSGWTLAGNTNPLYTTIDTATVNSGTYAAKFGPVGSVETLSQTIADNPGDLYTLNFYLASEYGTPSNFYVQINGTGGFSIIDGGAQPFTLYHASFTGTGNDVITFGFQDDPAFLRLDDVSVTGTGGSSVSPVATPEPSGAALLGTGLVGLAGLIRLRGKRIV